MAKRMRCNKFSVVEDATFPDGFAVQDCHRWEADSFPYRRMKKLRFRPARLKFYFVVIAVVALTGCAFLSNHRFTPPAKDWQARNGQLQYRTSGMTVVGDVLVRFSKDGDFELTFSKGPGVNLFTIQQDATFAHVKSSLTHLSWSGPVDHAPQQLRGWLSLREKLLSAPHQKVVRQTVGDEKFVFRF
jgi:hypothetical protein